MCYQAPAPPCLFPSAMCVEKKSNREIRAAGKGLDGVLWKTKHDPAFDLSRCFFRNTLRVDNILILSKLLCIKGTRAKPAARYAI